MLKTGCHLLAGALLFASASHFVKGAVAADVQAPSLVGVGQKDPADSFEVRFGAFAHGVGSIEKNTLDLNAELVSPRLFRIEGLLSAFIPRLHAGGNLNVSGRTSFAYLGLLWTIPVYDRFFIEGFVGPAVHNGSLSPTATLAGLGCPVLFHAGGSIGYRLSDHWRVMGTFSHLSNGRGVFGVDCGTNQGPGRNQGQNNYGIRLGYSF